MEAVPMKSESERNKKWSLLYWVVGWARGGISTFHKIKNENWHQQLSRRKVKKKWKMPLMIVVLGLGIVMLVCVVVLVALLLCNQSGEEEECRLAIFVSRRFLTCIFHKLFISPFQWGGRVQWAWRDAKKPGIDAGQKYHLEQIGVDRHCRRSRRASRAQRALLPRRWLGMRRRRGRICTSASHAVSYRWSCAGTLCATPQARQAPSLTKLLFQIGENMAYSDNTCPHCGTTMDREWLWIIWRHCRGQGHWHHGQWWWLLFRTPTCCYINIHLP